MDKRAIPPFDPLGEETSVAQRWRRYMIEMESYFAGMDIVVPKIKRGKLLYFAGEEVRLIWSTLEEDASQVDEEELAARKLQAAGALDDTQGNAVLLQGHLEEAAAWAATARQRAAQNALDDGAAMPQAERMKRQRELRQSQYAVIGVQSAKVAADMAVQKATKLHEDANHVKDEYECCVEALSKYFAPSKNYMFERYNFHKILPRSEETSCQYLTRLKGASVNCNFSNADDDILGMLVLHTRSNELRKEMLKGGDELTYVKARELARSLETAELQAKAMTGAQPSPNFSAGVGVNSEIHRLAAYHKTGGYRKKTCFGCGKEGHFMYDMDCSAKGHECSKCHRKGHFSTQCRRDSYYNKEGGGTDDESDNEKKKNTKFPSTKSSVHYFDSGDHNVSVLNSANIFCVSDKPVSELDYDVTCSLGGGKC